MSAMGTEDCSAGGERRQKQVLVVCDLPRAAWITGARAKVVAVVVRMNKLQ
jgi:hypothetical protein